MNNINKLIENFEKNQTEILELNTTTNELKNSIEGFDSRLEDTEERIIKLEDRSFKIVQSKEHKEERPMIA